MEGFHKVGYISKTHGLKGELTVTLDAHAFVDFDVLKALFTEQQDNPIPYFIERASARDNKVLLKFEDIDTLEAAAALVGSHLYVPQDHRPPSGENDFYIDEVIGYSVHDEVHGAIGPVRALMEAGPKQLLVVEYQSREVLIPIDSPFVKHIDKTARTLTVILPDGLLEL